MAGRGVLQIIPVLDVKHSAVVWAQRGDRAAYRPIDSPLAPGCDPVVMAQALLARCAVPGQPLRLYGADLDALEGGAPQASVLARLARALPQVELWWDAGFADAGAAAFLARETAAPLAWRPVYGSESLADEATLRGLRDDPSAILSLDRRQDQPLDRLGCWDRPEVWPATVVVMTLERVGSAQGPDLDTLARVRRRAGPGRTVIGAGGVRHDDDVAAAAAAGADGWLVASALHAGTLRPV